MSREAFEAALNALPAQKRWGTPKQLAWEAWQAATAAALDEAAEACEARKIITPEWQLDQHYNQAATHCDQDGPAMPQRTAQAGRESTGANIMTPRAQRTDPIYNRCLICGQAGHCSASCTQGRCNAQHNRPASAGPG